MQGLLPFFGKAASLFAIEATSFFSHTSVSANVAASVALSRARFRHRVHHVRFERRDLHDAGRAEISTVRFPRLSQWIQERPTEEARAGDHHACWNATLFSCETSHDAAPSPLVSTIISLQRTTVGDTVSSSLTKTMVGSSVGAFRLEMSVDQDLTVVAEAIDDDVVKRWLVPIVFTRARHDSRAHMYMTSPTLANKDSRKRVQHTLMLNNLVDSGDNTDPDEDCRIQTVQAHHKTRKLSHLPLPFFGFSECDRLSLFC